MNRLSNKGQFLSYVSAVLLSVFLVAAAVFGATTISTNITTDGTLSVSDIATFSAQVRASSTVLATGAVNFYSTLAVTGNSSVNGLATTTGATGDFNTMGAMNASSSVAVSGTTWLYGNLNFGGFATGTVANGNIATRGAITASGTAAFGGVTTSYGNLLVNGFATTTASTGEFRTLGGLFATGTVAFGSGGNGNRVNMFATTTVSQTASTSVSQELNIVGDVFVGGANGTTSLYLDTAGAGQGSCIQMRGATSSLVYRIYISEGGSNVQGVSTVNPAGDILLRVERGTCQ